MSYLAPVFEPVGSSHSSPLHDLHSRRSASQVHKFPPVMMERIDVIHTWVTDNEHCQALNLSVPGFGMAPNVTGYERKNDGPDWDSNPLDPLYLYSGALATELSGAGYLNQSEHPKCNRLQNITCFNALNSLSKINMFNINYINILTAIFRLIFIVSSVVITVASTIFKQMCRTVTEIYKCL